MEFTKGLENFRNIDIFSEGEISGDYLFQNVLTNDLDLDNPIFPSSLIFTHYFHHF